MSPLLLVGPLLTVVALLIKLGDGGPALFRHRLVAGQRHI
jgi:lipopolysaccharide/colanic/teichoic acid biosynthesis glycosyltransferase